MFIIATQPATRAKQRVCFYLTEELWNDLRARKDRTDVPISLYVERTLRHALQTESATSPRPARRPR